MALDHGSSGRYPHPVNAPPASVDRAEHVRAFDRNRRWFVAHHEEILARYAEEFVAVLDEHVVAHSPDFHDMLAQLRAARGATNEAFHEYASAKPLEMIL